MIKRRSILLGINLSLAFSTSATFANEYIPSALNEVDNSRIALLIGNKDYPGNFDLPSMGTNAKGLSLALGKIGFKTKTVVDGNRDNLMQAITDFSKAIQKLPTDGIAIFYFCGHGIQIDTENFLLPAGVLPNKRSLDESYSSYIALWRHLLDNLPKRNDLLVATVLDCCRSSPKPISNTDGLNQVRAPSGEIIVFSTGSGKFALAPIDAEKYTFFTGALINRLEELSNSSEELSFGDMFRLVSNDVYESMTNSPISIIRSLAQQPFITDNSSRPILVNVGDIQKVANKGANTPSKINSPSSLQEESPKDTVKKGPAEDELYDSLRGSTWPDDIRKYSELLLLLYPASKHRSEATVAKVGAMKAQQVLTNPGNDINLDKSDFRVPAQVKDQALVEDMRRSGRGDKDAAGRVALRFKPDKGGTELAKYEAWMQFAGLLGDGIACYELSRHYNELSMPSEAVKWSSRAKRLGYNAPTQLRTTR